MSKHTRHKYIDLQIRKAGKTFRTGDINTPLSVIDRSSREKISRDKNGLNNTINHIDVVDIHRVFHPKSEHNLLSRSRRIFIKIEHTPSYKTHINKWKIIETLKIMFSD